VGGKWRSYHPVEEAGSEAVKSCVRCERAGNTQSGVERQWMKTTRRSPAPEVVMGIEQAFTKTAKQVKGRFEDESMTFASRGSGG
jgi:hypothetical protein